jgi:hypothetical protein
MGIRIWPSGTSIGSVERHDLGGAREQPVNDFATNVLAQSWTRQVGGIGWAINLKTIQMTSLKK